MIYINAILEDIPTVSGLQKKYHAMSLTLSKLLLISVLGIKYKTYSPIFNSHNFNVLQKFSLELYSAYISIMWK